MAQVMKSILKLNDFFDFIGLEQKFQLLWQSRIIINPDIIHSAETDLAVVATVREIITDKENLIKRVAMLGGITQHSIQLVVLLRSDVERSCATDEHGIILEYFLNLREHRASFDLVRIESEFGLLAGLGAKQSESHHTGLVIFKRLAAEVGVTIFLAQIVAALLEELFVHLRLVLPDNLELAVHNTAFGHAIVAKDCDRIFTHLLVDSLAIASPAMMIS